MQAPSILGRQSSLSKLSRHDNPTPGLRLANLLLRPGSTMQSRNPEDNQPLDSSRTQQKTFQGTITTGFKPIPQGTTSEILARARQQYQQQKLQQQSQMSEGGETSARSLSGMKRTHTYKVMARPQLKMLEKIREAGLAANMNSSLFNNQSLPQLVQKQETLKKEGDPKSPFLVDQERLVTPRVMTSRVSKATLGVQQPQLSRNASQGQFKLLGTTSGLNTLSRETLLSNFKITKHRQSLNSLDEGIQEELEMTQELGAMRKNYLPLEAYDPWLDQEEDPSTLIGKYRDPETGFTLALSKWFFSSAREEASFEIRQCQVLQYLKQEEQFEIRWLCNGVTKRATRFNLIFQREDQQAFARRQEQAENLRQAAELVMKYQYLVNKQPLVKPVELSDAQKMRVSYRVKSYLPFEDRISKLRYRDVFKYMELPLEVRYQIPKSLTENRIQAVKIEEIHRDFKKHKFNLKQLALLFKEVDKDYLITHKNIIFEHKLPYQADLYQTFHTIVDPEKFIPVAERSILRQKQAQGYNEKRGLITIQERSQPFQEVLLAMKKKLHQANQEKLETLNRVQANMIRLEKLCFFKLAFTTSSTNRYQAMQDDDPVSSNSNAQSLEVYFRANRVHATEALREVRNHMFDSQYEISTMVQAEAKRLREAAEARRKAASCESKLKEVKKEEVMGMGILSPEYVEEVKKFQGLMNMLYERQVRECFEKSVERVIKVFEGIQKDMLESSQQSDEVGLNKLMNDPVLAKLMERRGFQWKMTLTFVKEQGTIQLQPSPQEWLTELQQLVKFIVEEISFVPCFQQQSDEDWAEAIGSARKDGRIKIFQEEDTYVEEQIGRVKNILDTINKFPYQVEQMLSKYSYILAIDIKQMKKDYKKNDYPIERYQQELQQYQQARLELAQLFTDSKLQCGLYLIRVHSLNKALQSRLDDLNKLLFSCIKLKIDQSNSAIENEVSNVLARISKDNFKNIEEVSEVEEFLKNMGSKEMLKIKGHIQDTMQKMGLLEVYQCRMLEEEFARTWRSFSKPLDIFKAEAECKKRMKRDEKEFFSDLKVMVERLQRDFEELKIEFDILQRSDDLKTDYEDAVTKCDSLMDKLERALSVAEVANRRENLFNLKLTDFSAIDDLKEAFTPYNSLWCLAREYFYKINNWMNGPLGEMDREKIPQEINEACQTLLKLERVEFKERKQTAQVCIELRKLYESFKPYLPLIVALRNPSLKMRHWDNLQKLRNPPVYELESELHASIQELVEGPAKIMEILEEIADISDCATREKKLEDNIQKMKDEWKYIKFDLQEFRGSGTYVLKAAEPIWDLLDDHIMKTITIASSPYIKFLQSEVNYWKYTLVKVQEILEEWTKTQRGWLYLWPIFVSDDIQLQLPLITASFQTVDKLWRNIMQSTFQNPNVLDSCLQARVHENLQQCNEMIERIQKGLNDYLHTKRLAFPRFFFLSNDDLLHILSQTKDPLRVQEHLNKCFEGIDKLHFSEHEIQEGKSSEESDVNLAKNKSFDILGMHSQLGEYIEFSQKVSPYAFKDSSKKNGEREVCIRNIEEWLADVETQMRESLRRQIAESSIDFEQTPRVAWLFEWPQQIILTLDQIQWTQTVEREGIQKMKHDSQALKKIYRKEEEKLKELVDLIQKPDVVSDTIKFMTLGALIVLDVHSKDVTKELVQANVSESTDFDWIAQLRYYIGNDANKSSIRSLDSTVGQNQLLEINVKMVNTSRLYGFEYLGNQTRLVITPLTDRCYRTLMGALQLNLGGAPEGPAGTGKTETTKDLAKAVAKQCIVFNCSDQLDVGSMAKFFKGLSCCGAWACFDEFNRIELEVLSVIAQQILTIQTALMRRRPFAPFIFDDEQIPMNPTCAVFITMNPGYAGRSELPDNLKALFRPVAMMIPNYAMIAEISLYSYGFQSARQLSVKITSSLRLASEQLSTQSHYDYGMRAVKSIILAAGALKGKNPTEDEYRLCLRAISDCNLPKFLSDDIPLFKGIISDLFPQTNKERENYQYLEDALRKQIVLNNLEENQEFLNKAIQLYETVQVRHGLMMVGGTMSAKTTLVKTLAQSLSSQIGNIQRVKINTINPKAVSIGQLYGDFDKISHDWTDGVLAAIVKESASDKSGSLRWIMMDGPVDAVWIENLNTVLDDNKKLCLTSGEIVKFTGQMTMMFEVEDLLEASPATVSRCGMVYSDPEKLGWQVQLTPWVRSLPSQLRSIERDAYYKDLISYYVKEVNTLFYEDYNQKRENNILIRQIVSVSKNQAFHSFLRLFECLLMKQETRQSLQKKEQEQRDRLEAKRALTKLQNSEDIIQASTLTELSQPALMTDYERQNILNLIIFALIWTYGGILDYENRQKFNLALNNILNDPQNRFVGISIPLKNDQVHDYFSSFFHTEQRQWLRWDQNIANSIQKSEDYHSFELPDKNQLDNPNLVESQSIIVPTEDTVRNEFILSNLVHHSFHVVFIGETGTGKTSTIKKFISDLSKDEWEKGQMVFSATSSANQVQSYISSKVEKQKKGVFGPKVPGHRLTIFIDDLNLPAKEKYGAQPPLEAIRQIIDNGGFYDTKSNEFHKIVDLQLIGAMGLPGGGRSLPTSRLLRHFNLINIPAFSSANLFRIFSRVLELSFQKHPQSWQQQIRTLTQLSIKLYENVVKTLLPLPAKSHYLFNLRQVGELVQGLTLVPAHFINKKYTDSKSQVNLLQKLWVHESMRVFSDRLINQQDQQIFQELLQQTVDQCQSGNKFPLIEHQTLTQAKNIIFNNFVVFDQFEPVYQEAPSDIGQMEQVIQQIIEYHAQVNKDQKISILLFDYMIQHLSRISRILHKPFGNGVLIGIGGNGRKTLAKLAAFINDCSTFKVDIGKSYGKNDWQDDMKTLFKSLGIDNKKIVFNFSDIDIKQDYFIEDISSILNLGEIPNLFTQEEIDEITFEIQKTLSKRALIGEGGSESKLREIFSNRCRCNFHLLLFISPAGPKLRQYIRLYPSLVNCTSIDWFLTWPEEALQKVAYHYLSRQVHIFPVQDPTIVRQEIVEATFSGSDLPQLQDDIKDPDQQLEPKQQFIEVKIPLSEEQIVKNEASIALRNQVQDIFVQIHASVLQFADDFYQDKGRQIYITPTRFTENFAPFEKIVLKKTSQIEHERQTYMMGIKKLDEANMIVDGMKIHLEELKPILEQKTKEVEKIMINLERETREIESAKAIVDQEAQIVYAQRDIAEGIKNECQMRLAEAQPLLDEALKALRTLNVKDFVIMKSFNTPPAPIKLALEAACIMLGIQPKLIDPPAQKLGSGKKLGKIPDYWEKSKKLLNDYKKFLSSLENYEKDNIPDDRIHKIQEYLENPKFVPEEIRKASEAAEGICKWVIAICKYDIIAKEIRPKREALGVAQEELDVVMKKLQEKEHELQKIIDQKNKLEEELKHQNLEKYDLISQRDECQAKLNRAAILIGSLSHEKERWIKQIEILNRNKLTIISDSILASAFIAYLGAFDVTYREKAVNIIWKSLIISAGLITAEEFNLSNSIGVQITTLQTWQLKGLPQDSVSIENIIIHQETKHQWPILIDPQGYAFSFLKEYLDQDFISVKVSINDGGKYLRKLETALFQGSTVICEGFTDQFDSSLSSLVLKDIQEVRGDKYLNFNDNQIEVNEKFRLFLVTLQGNPHFSPDIHSRCKILNFSVTKEGLLQQLLSVVCRNESTRDEDEKDRLLRQNIEFQEQKRVLEDQILEQLRNSGADILDDDTLVNSLNDSKKITDDIKLKLASAKVIEDRIEENRKMFKPVAAQAATLYFVVQQLSVLDPMYQFSMKWFRELFMKSFCLNEKVKDLKGRVRQLKQDFARVLYTNVCRCLFEHHKLMFAFNMAINLHMDDQHGEKESFSKRLKELESLANSNNQNSLTGNSQHLQQMAHIKGSVGKISIAKRSIIDKKSDSNSQTGGQLTANLGGNAGILSKNDEEKLKIHKDELHYLLTGLILNPNSNHEERSVNPCESFIDNKIWNQICEIAQMHQFDNLPDEIERNPATWKKFMQRSDQHIPEPFSSSLSDFSQIILHKVLKPEKTIVMIQKYVTKALGSFFVKPVIQSMDEIFLESKPHIPLILILTPGNDPMEQIKKFAEEKQKLPYPVSLGKGQGDKAKAVIQEYKQYGGWVVLQNCHLASSFLPELEQIYENLQPHNISTSTNNKSGSKVTSNPSNKNDDENQNLRAPHPDFRMWLTSMSIDSFPMSILADSIKLTSEPPKGIKSTLQRIFNQVESSKAEKEFFNANSKPQVWRKMFLALSFFHGVVRERRRFGSFGWNQNYDFNDSDFRVSMRQLHLMIDQFAEMPFRALNYLTGECNYGGRVTDDWDRRTLTTLLKDFHCSNILDDPKYQFVQTHLPNHNHSALPLNPLLSVNGQPVQQQSPYYILQEAELDDYVTYVSTLPDDESPLLVGLHTNASITQAINDSNALLSNILRASSSSANNSNISLSSHQNQMVSKMAEDILAQIREPYKIKEKVEPKYPFKYEESMNSVLLQELARYNNLIVEIRSSLKTLILTLEGKLVMNSDMEKMLNSIMSNSIPENWRQKSYPSKKPLLSYVKDLSLRLKYFDTWIEKGQPSVFWISGFFFTQSFLTGVKQNFARKYTHPIDRVGFRFEITSEILTIQDLLTSLTLRGPDIGCMVTGLYLEGASWDMKNNHLAESEPKTLNQLMPVMHFIPIIEEEAAVQDVDQLPSSKPSQDANLSASLNESSTIERPTVSYQCPVYKTSARAGTLSTTGHSTNYILTCQLAAGSESEDHWVKRSVALLSQLDD